MIFVQIACQGNPRRKRAALNMQVPLRICLLVRGNIQGRLKPHTINSEAIHVNDQLGRAHARHMSDSTFNLSCLR